MSLINSPCSSQAQLDQIALFKEDQLQLQRLGTQKHHTNVPPAASIRSTSSPCMQYDKRSTAGAETHNGDLQQHHQVCPGLQPVHQGHRAHSESLCHCALHQAGGEGDPVTHPLCVPAGEGLLA